MCVRACAVELRAVTRAHVNYNCECVAGEKITHYCTRLLLPMLLLWELRGSNVCNFIRRVGVTAARWVKVSVRVSFNQLNFWKRLASGASAAV